MVLSPPPPPLYIDDATTSSPLLSRDSEDERVLTGNDEQLDYREGLTSSPEVESVDVSTPDYVVAFYIAIPILLVFLLSAICYLVCSSGRYRKIICFSRDTAAAEPEAGRERHRSSNDNTSGDNRLSTRLSRDDIASDKVASNGNGNRLSKLILDRSANSGYGTILSANENGGPPPGVGPGYIFPSAPTVNYVLLTNKSVDSPESQPSSPTLASMNLSESAASFDIPGRKPAVTPPPPKKCSSEDGGTTVARRLKAMGLFATSRSSNSAPPKTLSVQVSEPCRIIVDAPATDDKVSPDSTRRLSGSNTSLGGAGGSGGDRRGSLSPRTPSGGGVRIGWNSVPSKSLHDSEDQFWVPPNIMAQKKRALSLTPPSASLASDSTTPPSGETLNPNRKNWIRSANSASEVPTLMSSLSTDVDVTGADLMRRCRRASMQDALDCKMIDASLYERPPPLSSQKPVGNVHEDNIGSVNFSIFYHRDQSLFTVKLIQAIELVPGSRSKTAHPFARVSLLPERRHQLQSRIHRNTLAPQFDEEFAFEVSARHVTKKTVEILLFDADDEERCMGQVHLPLDQVDLTEGRTSVWKGISQCEKKPQIEFAGDVSFSLSYLRSAERLTVVVDSARQLKSRELSAKTIATNPFVRVTTFVGAKKMKRKKTTTKRNTTSPEWNEAVVFNVSKDQLESLQVELAVFSENLLGTDVAFGKVVVGGNTSGEELFHWKDFLKGKPGLIRWHCLCPMKP